VDGAPTPTYEVPVGGSRLAITLTNPDRWWQVGQVVAVFVLAFLAVPFGRRESRVRAG
jgi:lipopolysaccharide export LptBFGC system permease protein LptF